MTSSTHEPTWKLAGYVSLENMDESNSHRRSRQVRAIEVRLYLVLKSEGRNSVFPNRIFLLKNCRRHLAYSFFQDLLAVLPRSSWCADIRGCVFWFGSSKREPSQLWIRNIAWDKTFFKKKWPSTQDFDTYCISNVSLCISCLRDTAAKSSFLATISHKVKFSKDSFKIGGYN